MALTYCDDNDGQWAICSQRGNPSTLQNGAFCSCTEAAKATVAFKDTETLSNLVSLPQNTGDTMSFFPGYSPPATVPTAGTTGGGKGGGGQASTAPPKTTVSRTLAETPSAAPSPARPPPAATGIAASSSTSSPLPSPLPPSSDSHSGSSSATTFTDANGKTTTATVTRTATSPSDTGAGSTTGSSDDGSSESGGLDTGAKIGVGVGVAVGGVLLIALVLLLLRQRRRGSHRPAKGMEDGSTPSSEPKVPMADGAAILEADGRPAKPHKLRGELGEGTAAAAAVERRSSSKLKSRHRPRPSDDSAVSELDGSSLGGAGPGAEGYGSAAVPPGEELSPVAELPATEVQPGGGKSYGRQLASDDSLVPAPLQIRRSEDGGGNGASQATTALSPPPAAAAARGPMGASQGAANGETRDEGAQVKPWGARWRRT